jgi:hypothetical protein
MGVAAMEETFRHPIELIASELDAVAGGALVNLNITVIAANGIADGIANGIANGIFGGGNGDGIAMAAETETPAFSSNSESNSGSKHQTRIQVLPSRQLAGRERFSTRHWPRERYSDSSVFR